MEIDPRRRLALLSLDAHIANRHQGCWGNCDLYPCVSDRRFLQRESPDMMMIDRLDDALAAKERRGKA